jgi:hypothetical protein
VITTTLTVQVPPDRLREFYLNLADLFEQPETEINEGNLMLWDEDEPSDSDTAQQLYADLSPLAKGVYDLLFAHPEGFTVEELATKLGKSKHQIRGALSHPARNAVRAGKVPIHSQRDDGTVFVHPSIATMFKSPINRK